MTHIKRLLLDILKPHHPDVIDFSKALARTGNCQVRLTVAEIDARTETLQVEIKGDSIDYEQIQAAIAEMGASIHSIDVVEVEHNAADRD
ncbi:DUF211 domain-containing protein [Sedimenticola thiotaurini]|uniref:DUF211 domain-containing protein n=1 Tax=Sedimenticola thiotaurini TaxID=1543721 RepID=A0A0F7K1U0_9GAMM|nr:DUF211 domain-containing protein [Sedimenticola thiotaurini]AKH21842.1 hypothetical protein AAY24_17535 [Sedimenticola thiotaurini]